MNTLVITTKDCSRCSGTGHYSYCERYGTKCFKCGGTGKIACTPKGQKKLTPDCTDINVAQVGQIVLHACVLYRVEDIKWIKPVHKGYSMFNQRARVTRLVDEKEFFLKREFAGYNPESACWSMDYQGGTKTNGKEIISTPEDLIGTEYDPAQYDKSNEVILPISQEEMEAYKQREAMWK